MSKLSGAFAGAALMLYGARTFVAPSSQITSAPRAPVQAGGQSTFATSTAQLAGMGVGVAAVTAAMVGGRATRRRTQAASVLSDMKMVAEVSDDSSINVKDLVEKDKAAFPLYRDSPGFPVELAVMGGPGFGDTWDPLGLSTNASAEQLIRWRAVEVKHGRVCMLACAGWWANAQGYHPVGDAGARSELSDDPIIALQQMPMAGMWQLVFTIMVLEWLFEYVCKPPANRPWDIFGWEELLTEEGQYEADYIEAQLQETNNGRLAMIGILGLIGTEIGSGGKNYGKLLPEFPQFTYFGGVQSGANWPVADPRFDAGTVEAYLGGFNNFLLYAQGINPFADQLV